MSNCSDCPTVFFVKSDKNAIFPTKGTSYSIGYDLTAISVYKKIGSKTTLFDTGIRLDPPEGYYTEIIPRSSLSNTGYMLSNSIGIIDPDYRGNLLIALTKIDETMPDLKTPFTKCQLVLRKANYFNLNEVVDIPPTVRGCGGFGSTDKS
jgi:dUTP pyrophosphatase